MDKNCFTDSKFLPLQCEASFPWNASSEQLCADQYSHFSSSLTTTSSFNEACLVHELIGKLGGATESTLYVSSGAAFHSPSFGSSAAILPLAADPGFGNRSFNGRTIQLGQGSSNPLKAELKFPRVSSSPVLKHGGSPYKLGKLLVSDASSNDDSSVSNQIPRGETGSKTSNELNCRKRKAVSTGKSEEDGSNFKSNGDKKNIKRSKNTQNETNATTNNGNEKQKADDKKAPEPPKDYIHVRARRGQATDSHSLAERVRREKISERMKLLQDLVPGCNKVTGKALMLDEIISYVQSLQRQVEFLSMKLASVNPGPDFNMENLLSKEMFQQKTTTLPQHIYPLDPSAPLQNAQQLHPMIPPSFDGFCGNLPSQFLGFSEDDLHSIVQMGFVQNPVNFPVGNQMKVER